MRYGNEQTFVSDTEALYRKLIDQFDWLYTNSEDTRNRAALLAKPNDIPGRCGLRRFNVPIGLHVVAKELAVYMNAF